MGTSAGCMLLVRLIILSFFTTNSIDKRTVLVESGVAAIVAIPI